MLKKILLLFITIFFVEISNAQEIPAPAGVDVGKVIQQAQQSGLSESELMKIGESKGYSQNDLLQLKAQEQAKQNKRIQNNPIKDDQNQTENFDEEDKNRKNRNKARADETDAQFIKRKIEEEKRSGIFGLNIFNNPVISFEPNLKIATPRNYILGVGDQITINISGYAQATYNCTVSSEGTITIENLHPIYVNGESIEQASAKITQKLKTIFGGLGNQNLIATVNVTKIRSIQVTVIGEAVYPGSYTVPSLATVFNLLYSAGGPTSIGSMRNIEVHRGGKLIRKMDLYDFLLHGDLKDNIVLRDQDVIRIPYVDLQAEVKGQVKNPKIYELHNGDNLNTLLGYAGGFTDDAFQKRIRLVRIGDIQKSIRMIEKSQFSVFIPKKGDQFTIDAVGDFLDNVVYVTGAVKRPGWFEIESAPTLSKLIQKAEGITANAFLDRILIKRFKPNLDPELIQVDYTKIINGQDPDLILYKYDSVVVKSISDLRGARSILIDGEVNKPQVIPYIDNLTIANAIYIAGGFTDGASGSRIEISRRVYGDTITKTDDQTVEIIGLNISKNLSLNPEDSKILLKPFDKIYIRRLARYENQKKAIIAGEVIYPGPYSINDNGEKISDLIIKSGGLKKEGDIKSAKFNRSGTIVAVDLEKIMSNPKSSNNLMLYDGDVLTIPRKVETVNIAGNVYIPITVPYQNGLKLQDYISLAGGTSDSANLSKIYVRYSNNRLHKTQKYLGFKIYPKIQPGSEIIVPTRRKSRLTPAERIAISSAVISVATVLISIILRVLPNN